MEYEETNRWLDQVSGDLEELYQAIDEGEHQQQDFKFRIDSTRKIAITLVAFANTQGGKLLIGVKDNGRIAGIDPEEEYYMIEGAASMYCKPPVSFKTRVFEDEEGRKVLEIDVPPSAEAPHYAKTAEDSWRVYLRQDDENFAANRVIIEYLKNKHPDSKKKNLVAYGPEERELFDLLGVQKEISISAYRKKADIDIVEAEKILVLFLQWEIISYRATDKGIRFFLLD
ncbi:MAG TPA: ATP-binding protein [Cryomorphaceae bacterium]|nr:ATP-binding protein [Owenweeksia sp.]MBF99658.1 ATP-binding protein [Owenweeksia sp.]HAD96199.1 ATP-binding protein [Cryomorphaceae bacterium]HBF18717.1 ATP-binding protein [Cryomorphaceae bacterium]HCQ16426.1 ATP-binding protein [Cryomorphaceae bacterium]|tara:strand:- start:498 stop:1181 length:684 start_codon:yes stop_codon:yes gene_type:complete